MLNFDRFIYNRTTLPKDELEKKKFFENLEQQFYEEIKNSEFAQEYFKSYHPNTIDSFVKRYAYKKTHLAQCYTFYSNRYYEKEVSELKFQEKAADMLEIILQKKLFNMQLLWRAGQLGIDEISISWDFRFWEKHILSCPFIPPIEVHEVDLMKEYLLLFNEYDEVDRGYFGWQDYDQVTAKDTDGTPEYMPEWYQFYDSRMGTGTLLLLPDHKGKKEEYYLNILREENSKNKPPVSYPPQAPSIYSDDQNLIDFCKYFETDKYFHALFKYHKYYNEKENRRPNYDDVDEAIKFLFTAERPIHCQSHLTWDKAIMAAAKEYKNTRIAESLDFVFEEYLMMKDLGIMGQESAEEIKDAYIHDSVAEIYRKAILDGRKMNGEPEDFNY
jgi:hypothetical protein